MVDRWSFIDWGPLASSCILNRLVEFGAVAVSRLFGNYYFCLSRLFGRSVQNPTSHPIRQTIWEQACQLSIAKLALSWWPKNFCYLFWDGISVFTLWVYIKYMVVSNKSSFKVRRFVTFPSRRNKWCCNAPFPPLLHLFGAWSGPNLAKIGRVVCGVGWLVGELELASDGDAVMLPSWNICSIQAWWHTASLDNIAYIQ